MQDFVSAIANAVTDFEAQETLLHFLREPALAHDIAAALRLRWAPPERLGRVQLPATVSRGIGSGGTKPKMVL